MSCSVFGPLVMDHGREFDSSRFLVATSPGCRTKRHPQSCSTQVRGRLHGPEFPQMSVRNDVPCICPLRRDVHIIDNIPGYTDTFSTTSAYATSSPLETSLAARPSASLAIARLPSSGTNPLVYGHSVHAGTASLHRTRTRTGPCLHLPLG